MTRISTGIASLDGSLYAQLRRLAGYYMRMERSGHTLQPTALVHEEHAPIALARGFGRVTDVTVFQPGSGSVAPP